MRLPHRSPRAVYAVGDAEQMLSERAGLEQTGFEDGCEREDASQAGCGYERVEQMGEHEGREQEGFDAAVFDRARHAGTPASTHRLAPRLLVMTLLAAGVCVVGALALALLHPAVQTGQRGAVSVGRRSGTRVGRRRALGGERQTAVTGDASPQARLDRRTSVRPAPRAGAQRAKPAGALRLTWRPRLGLGHLSVETAAAQSMHLPQEPPAPPGGCDCPPAELEFGFER